MWPRTWLLLLEWADAYAPSSIRDEYSEPLRADVAWWKDLSIHDLLVAAGEVEVFRDDIRELGSRISQSGVSTKTVTLPNHTHEADIQDTKT